MLTKELDPRDYAKMQERIALVCNLRNGRLPEKIATASRMLVRVKSGGWNWAYYDPNLEHVRFLEGYETLIPHELVHHLHNLNGNPVSDEEEEARARWLQSVYWELWPS